MPFPKRKASGRNIPDCERHTLRVTLRLDPEVAESLRAYALAWGCTLADVVETALSLLDSRGRPR